jgi:hypothetical protein
MIPQNLGYKKSPELLQDFGGESRIRTCEVFTTDLQSALVGRLSISPYAVNEVANIELFLNYTNLFLGLFVDFF